MKRPAFAAFAVVFLAAAVVVTAAAQNDPEPERPTLHQDIVPPARGDGRASTLMDGKSVFGPSPTAGQNPSAFANGEKILPQPERKTERRGKEPILGQGGFAADRDTHTKPDRSTGADSTLQYVTVFNPSVLPFKRMSAMNSVTANFELETRGPNTREDLDVGGAPSQERDLFWGSVMVQLKTGADVPLPSVAPDMRLLSYEVEPRVELRFSKDSSDNYYVRSDEAGVSGTYRLVFMADADALYFAPKVPNRYTVSQVTRHRHRPASFTPLPANVQQQAEKAMRKLGVRPQMRLDEALDRLTYYFRGFSAKDLPRDTGNTYWDLFINQAGVCRHRSYAFMITATALGLPTRYVTNEAHAWVEVWVPDYWMRIDLGGAALRMNVDNASDKSLHQPRDEDPFKSPKEYEENYTQLEGDIGGLTQAQIDERRQTPSEAASQSNETDFNPEAPEVDSADTSKRVGPGRSLDELPPEEIENKIPGRIIITDTVSEAFRGEGLPVSGVLRETKTDKGIYGQRIDIWLAPVGRHGDNAELVGSTVTKADGSFSAIVSLPDNMHLREYEVYATSPGDIKYAPALSD